MDAESVRRASDRPGGALPYPAGRVHRLQGAVQICAPGRPAGGGPSWLQQDEGEWRGGCRKLSAALERRPDFWAGGAANRLHTETGPCGADRRPRVQRRADGRVLLTGGPWTTPLGGPA